MCEWCLASPRVPTVVGGDCIGNVAAGIAVGLFTEATRERATSSDWRDIFAGVLMASAVLLFLGLLFFKGLSTAYRAFRIFGVGMLLVDFAVVYASAGELRLKSAIPAIGLLILWTPAAIAGILARIVGGTFGTWAIAMVAVFGAVATGRADGGLAAAATSVILVLISRRALGGDARDGLMRRFGHRIATHRGTRFDRANLTGTDFRGTELRQSDMSSAILHDTVWEPGQVPCTPNHPG